MFDIFREKPRRTLLVFGSVALVAIAYLFITIEFARSENDGHIGALLDDTWIHVRFAWNISQGNGLAYNEGVLTSGATSPLWVMLLAIPFAIFQPDVFQQVDLAIYMSAIGHVLSVLAITGLGWWYSRHAWVGFVAGLITALTGRYIWMGLTGMEITTFTLLTILSVWSHMHDVREKRYLGWRTGILVALATLARPEAYLLAALIGFDTVVYIPLRDTRRWQANLHALKSSWRGILAYILLAGSYPFVILLIDGYPVPNTFRAKSYLGKEYPDLPRSLLWMANVDHGKLFIAIAFIGGLYVAWRALRRHADSAMLGIWGPLFILAVLYMGAERYNINHSRYIAPSIPFIALCVVLGVQALWQLAERYIANKKAIALLANGCLLLLVVQTFAHGDYTPRQVSNDVYQLRAMHVQAGYWFQDRTEPDALIALNDVGAIIHISNRSVLDLEGLVSPEVIEATNGTPEKSCEHDLQLMRVMMQQEPRFVGVFPWWYPCMISWDGALRAEAVFAIQGPTVLAGGEMVIYWPIWEQWPMQNRIPDSTEAIDVALNDNITLAATEIRVDGDTLVIDLWWTSQGSPSDDYHIFVHLIDENGQIVEATDGRSLQSDGLPQQRTTSAFNTYWWRAGDIIPDQHRIILDDQTVQNLDHYSINVGMYRYPSFQRLQRVDGQGDVINIPLSIRRIASDVAQ